MKREDLRRLPRTDEVARHPTLDAARRALGATAVTELARRVIAAARAEVLAGGATPGVEEVATRVGAAAAATLQSRMREVINATGVVLHTNLGRAPLSTRAAEAVTRAATGYASIEMELVSGKRGGRAAFATWALARLAGAEAALVVNNCAAAVLLALAAVQGPTTGRPIVVSRGELIEIGGGFRVPDVMARSGARLVEVGTTNKTKLADYERALDEHPDAAAVLRVHQGNFRQTGFVERPSLADLARLARARGIPLVKDLGGGALVDLEAFGLTGEPTVRACVAAGADVVCFSVDKVLGGPQGGVLVGKAAWIDRAARDPFARALRIGRLPLAALEATLESYLDGSLDELPTLAALGARPADVARRAEAWASALRARGIDCSVETWEGAVGGGALAEAALTSAGIALAGVDVEATAARLRAGRPAVIGRIQADRLCFDARTVLPGQDDALLDAIGAALVRP